MNGDVREKKGKFHNHESRDSKNLKDVPKKTSKESYDDYMKKLTISQSKVDALVPKKSSITGSNVKSISNSETTLNMMKGDKTLDEIMEILSAKGLTLSSKAKSLKMNASEVPIFQSKDYYRKITQFDTFNILNPEINKNLVSASGKQVPSRITEVPKKSRRSIRKIINLMRFFGLSAKAGARVY